MMLSLFVHRPRVRRKGIYRRMCMYVYMYTYMYILQQRRLVVVDDALQFSLQVSHILKQLIFLAVVVSVVEADKPPRADAVELTRDKAFDISLEALGLLSLLSLILSFHCSHLSFCCFFSRRDTDTNPLAASTSLLLDGSQMLPLNPPSKLCRR